MASDEHGPGAARAGAAGRGSGRVRWGRVALATAAWLALLFFVRFRYVQAEHLVEHCAAYAGDAVCTFRELTGQAMHFNLLGYASLALAVPAVLLPGRTGAWTARAALAAAAVALVLYNAGLGAVAAALALLRLARAASGRY
jgi:hypothetical protein